MSAGWVAGNVRADAMLNRRLGTERTREIASCPSLSEAQRLLAESPYRRGIQVGQSLEESEHAIAATLLWQLRVLAGWQPPGGVSALRALAAGFEVANIDTHAQSLARTVSSDAYFTLGGLAVSWSRLRATRSLAELRAALAASTWGDPGSERPSDIAIGVRLAWARAVVAGAPAAARWAVGAAALMVARRVLVEGAPLTAQGRRQASALLGASAPGASDLPTFVAALPKAASWALADINDVDELWRAEFAWWGGVERDAKALLIGSRFDASAPIGTTAFLAADAWRCRAALQVAAKTGPALEDYDALV